jgi:hypothetical protein
MGAADKDARAWGVGRAGDTAPTTGSAGWRHAPTRTYGTAGSVSYGRMAWEAASSHGQTDACCLHSYRTCVCCYETPLLLHCKSNTACKEMLFLPW